MVDLKNEVAGVVAIVGFVSLVLALAGVAGLLGIALGGGGNTLGPAVAAALGLSGLAACWAAIESGYFEPAEPSVGEEPPEADLEGEAESDAEPA